MTKEMEQLNPGISDVNIGVKTLRKIKIYPLSMGDQLRTTNILAEVMKRYFSEISGEATHADMAAFFIKAIEENLIKVLDMVTDDDESGEVLMDELTNDQAVKIMDLILTVNYLSISKNVKSLVEKTKEAFGIKLNGQSSTRQSPTSVSDTDIIQETSSTKDSSMEE